jgi:tetratricopeptide (TPR) repeat protein
MNLPRLQLLAIGFVVALCAALYGFTLNHELVFDDYIYLVQNPLAQDARSFLFPLDFTAFANKSRLAGLDPDLSTNFILRPFAYLTFYLNFAVGGFNPAGYRILNILLHGANGILIFLILSHLLRISQKRGTIATTSIDFISVLAALLFIAHPMQIESVTYVIQRFTSLSAFWYLFTLRAYFLSHTSVKPIMATAWHWCGLTGLLLGMMTKEILFTAPLMLVILDWLVVGTPFKGACRRAAPYLSLMPLIPILLVFISWAQRGDVGLDSVLRSADPFKPESYQYHYALTQPGVILTYLRLLLVPAGLNLDPDHPLVTSIWEWRVLGPMAILGVILAGAAWWYRRRTLDLRASLLFGSVVWFFLALSIDSSVVPLPDVMAEHRAYLPSIGAFTVLACLMDMLRDRLKERGRLGLLVPAGAAVWVLGLGIATINRNLVWKTEVSIWKDTTEKSPNKHRPFMNLGTAYFQERRFEEAASCFRRAIQLKPLYYANYSNLLQAQMELGQHREAIQVGLEGTRFTPAPGDHRLFQNLGAAYFKIGEYRNSITCQLAAVKSRPDYQPSHIALGELYAMEKEFHKSIHHYQIAASLAPLDSASQRTLNQLETLIRQSTGSR